MRILLIIGVCLVLTGCMLTPMTMIKGISAFKNISEQGLADKLLDNAIDKLCNWPTQGAIERKWGNNPTKLQQYHTFCDHGENNGVED